MKKDEAYEMLRAKIVTNGLAPGEILNEKDLMAQLSIGRSPLREVLFRLQEENMITPMPRLGYMVTPLNIAEVRDLVELRRELEGFAGRLAAERITPEQLEHMRTLFSEAENAPPDDHPIASVSEYFDTRFHDLLYQAADNQQLVRMLQDLHINMLRIWFHMGFGVIGFGQEAQNLYEVLEALEQGNPEKARTAMEAHVDLFATQIKNKFIADRH